MRNVLNLFYERVDQVLFKIVFYQQKVAKYYN